MDPRGASSPAVRMIASEENGEIPLSAIGCPKWRICMEFGGIRPSARRTGSTLLQLCIWRWRFHPLVALRLRSRTSVGPRSAWRVRRALSEPEHAHEYTNTRGHRSTSARELDGRSTGPRWCGFASTQHNTFGAKALYACPKLIRKRGAEAGVSCWISGRPLDPSPCPREPCS